MLDLKKVNKKKLTKTWFQFRNVVGTALLAAGTIGYIRDHITTLANNWAYGVAVFIVAMILFFTFKK